jgi:hypothetical protein
MIIGHGSLSLDSKDSLDDFVRKGTETNWKTFGLLELAALEYARRM